MLKSVNKNINVKFTVGTVTHILSSINGVKQRDIPGPILFTIFMQSSWLRGEKIMIDLYAFSELKKISF